MPLRWCSLGLILLHLCFFTVIRATSNDASVNPNWISKHAFDENSVKSEGEAVALQDIEMEEDDAEYEGFDLAERRSMLRGFTCEFGPCAAAGGAYHNCVIMHNHWKVKCWGQSVYGQLGLGVSQNVGDNSYDMPPPFVPLGEQRIKQIAAGEFHTCVVFFSGNVSCWGFGQNGRLGYGSQRTIGDEPGEMPPGYVPLAGKGLQISLGNAHTCVLLVEGTVHCWGNGWMGALGYGNREDIGDEPGEMPPPAVDVGGKVKQLSSGGYFNCVMLENREVRCWGDGRFGQAGNTSYLDPIEVWVGIPRNISDFVGDEEGEMPPKPVVVGGEVEMVSCGEFHTCAVMSGTYNVRCWGDNRDGQLGYGNTFNRGRNPGDMPPPDIPLIDTVRQVYGGRDKTCAMHANGNMSCWGSGEKYMLGNGYERDVGDEEGEMPPLPVETAGRVLQIIGGQYHVCAVTSLLHWMPLNASIRCWGANNFGQLGYGDRLSRGDVLDSPLPTPEIHIYGTVLISIPPPPPPPPPPPLHPGVNLIPWTLESDDLAKYTLPQRLEWPIFNNESFNDAAHAVTTDAWGNAYITGALKGAPLDEGDDKTSRWDCFIQKVNAGGTVQWTTTSVGTGAEVGRAITVDDVTSLQPNLYVTGWFDSENATFGDEFNQWVVSAHMGANETRSWDIWILKMSWLGTIDWVTAGGGNDTDIGYGIASDPVTKSIMLTGKFESSILTFGHNDTEVAVRNHGFDNYDILVLRMTSDGVPEYLLSFGGENTDYGLSIVVDKNSDAYVVGGFKSTEAVFAPIDGDGVKYTTDRVLRRQSTDNLYLDSMYWDNVAEMWRWRHDENIFVAKVSSLGSVAWVIEAGGLEVDEARAVTLSLDHEAVFVTGLYDSINCTFGDGLSHTRGRSDVFVMKVTSTGSIEWHVTGGGPETDLGRGITIDQYGDPYITGSFTHEATFGETALKSQDDSYEMDVLVAKVWQEGSWGFAVANGGQGIDKGFGIAATTAQSGGHSLFVAGTFHSGAGLNATFGQYQKEFLPAEVDDDVFLMKLLPKLNPPPPPPLPPSPPPPHPLHRLQAPPLPLHHHHHHSPSHHLQAHPHPHPHPHLHLLNPPPPSPPPPSPPAPCPPPPLPGGSLPISPPVNLDEFPYVDLELTFPTTELPEDFDTELTAVLENLKSYNNEIVGIEILSKVAGTSETVVTVRVYASDKWASERYLESVQTNGIAEFERSPYFQALGIPTIQSDLKLVPPPSPPPTSPSPPPNDEEDDEALIVGSDEVSYVILAGIGLVGVAGAGGSFLYWQNQGMKEPEAFSPRIGAKVHPDEASAASGVEAAV
ncbi:hypothetical protein CYMTET_27768 [Cymbomonas tetramitiformis]|uniref:RCC1-like domain-containing protein n=1 Tax=Cymbomonas tetramitiformis TaxID=36881 RepID=A0AAE0FPD9_9CHLO|nr:hypothetical protein CYMTET_27768 [Cymbomonas tetramitiformis]